jgi:hypothetical protein
LLPMPSSNQITHRLQVPVPIPPPNHPNSTGGHFHFGVEAIITTL